ncbi:MAG: heptosyltransferase-2 [Pseudomonadales bacterium]
MSIESASDQILIVGPSWVGDMVMAQSLYKALRHQNPNCAIDVLAPGWSLPVLSRMAEVRNVIDQPTAHGELAWGKRKALGTQLASVGYSQAILLPNSLKSALIPAFAKIPVRTGWRGEYRYGLLNDIRLLNKNRYPLMVERFVALAYELGAALPAPLPRPELAVDCDNQTKVLAEFSLSVDQPILALCPGAEFGPSKQWPARHYADVAKHYIAKGWQVWCFGSNNDVVISEEIKMLAGGENCHVVAGKTALGDAIDLLGLASAVVSNDSGLMHIAAALARPLVTVYGSTSADFTPPLSDVVEMVYTDEPCRPCFQRECPLGHLNCLNKLEAGQVISALERLGV